MGHFIVVGGGSKSDRRQLQIIMEYCGNHVDAWILTTPSAESVEGLNCIVTTEGYVVDRVYMPAIDYDNLPEGFMDEADWTTYEDFLDLAGEGLFELTCVAEGDEFVLYGMSFQILSDMLDVQEGDVVDNSMLFRMRTGNQSFLFCSCIGYEQGQLALEKYGEGLNSDYVQIASGSGDGLGLDFYDAVSPDIAFCDSLKDDAGRKTYDLLVSAGVSCYCLENGDPSWVTLE